MLGAQKFLESAAPLPRDDSTVSMTHPGDSFTADFLDNGRVQRPTDAFVLEIFREIFPRPRFSTRSPPPPAWF